jgi:hypothetical protein
MNYISTITIKQSQSVSAVSDISRNLTVLRESRPNILLIGGDDWCLQFQTLLNSLGYLATHTYHYIHPEKDIRIRVYCSWMNSSDIQQCWQKMMNGDRWNNIRYATENETPDYYIIINRPQPQDTYIPNRTIVFRMEPDCDTNSFWNDWYTNCEDFLAFMDLSSHLNNNEWHLGLTHRELTHNPITKTQTLSTVVSSLYNSVGHRLRIDFIRYMQTNGVEIDVYGRENHFHFRNYRGSLPYHKKDGGIIPYRYTFIAENCSLENYYTEKIVDAILGETLCFYWGCPNVSTFLDPESYIQLDLTDFPGSLRRVKSAIENDEWTARLPHIIREKQKILWSYSFFPRVESIINWSTMNSRGDELVNNGVIELDMDKLMMVYSSFVLSGDHDALILRSSWVSSGCFSPNIQYTNEDPTQAPCYILTKKGRDKINAGNRNLETCITEWRFY